MFVVLIILVIGLSCWLFKYRYDECRKIGGSVGYCVLDAAS